MSTTRRGFLKLLGTGVAAVAVAGGTKIFKRGRKARTKETPAKETLGMMQWKTYQTSVILNKNWLCRVAMLPDKVTLS